MKDNQTPTTEKKVIDLGSILLEAMKSINLEMYNFYKEHPTSLETFDLKNSFNLSGFKDFCLENKPKGSLFYGEEELHKIKADKIIYHYLNAIPIQYIKPFVETESYMKPRFFRLLLENLNLVDNLKVKIKILSINSFNAILNAKSDLEIFLRNTIKLNDIIEYSFENNLQRDLYRMLVKNEALIATIEQKTNLKNISAKYSITDAKLEKIINDVSAYLNDNLIEDFLDKDGENSFFLTVDRKKLSNLIASNSNKYSQQSRFKEFCQELKRLNTKKVKKILDYDSLLVDYKGDLLMGIYSKNKLDRNYISTVLQGVLNSMINYMKDTSKKGDLTGCMMRALEEENTKYKINSSIVLESEKNANFTSLTHKRMKI